MSSQLPASVAHDALEGRERHWQNLQRWIDMRAAAAACLTIIVAILVLISMRASQLELFYYDVNRVVNHRDLHYLDSLADTLLQDYLSQPAPPGRPECVLLGASFTAGADEPLPGRRLQDQLQPLLQQRDGRDWLCSNLAANGNVLWTMFYCARELRLHRPPQVLVVSLDTAYPRDRNLMVVLNLGVRPGELSPAELAPAVAYNQQPLYTSEANLKRWLREQTALFRGWNFAAYSYPTAQNIGAWVSFTLRRLRGLPPPSGLYSSSMHADGTSKNWREMPLSRARIEAIQHSAGAGLFWDDRVPAELDQLFAELKRCQEQGIRVVLLSMPKNPVLNVRESPLPEYARRAAARDGLEFHDFWASRLIPERLQAFTPNTLTTRQALLKELKSARETGLTYDREERVVGVYCIGAPVFDVTGNAVAGLGITGLVSRFQAKACSQFETDVLACAENVSKDIGYRGDAFVRFRCHRNTAKS